MTCPMKLWILSVGCLLLVGVMWWSLSLNEASEMSGAPPYGEPEEEVPEIDPWAWLRTWQRPEGPARVGLQVGHWNSAGLPDELERLRQNTGASGGGKWEWEVNLEIAEQTAELLRAQGVDVDILPATVPPKYWADVFVAIHADGSTDRGVSGYKMAAPWRDFTGNANRLVQIMEAAYEEATDMKQDPNITRNMRGYYAFSWWRYEHAIHPMTTAVIVETGFLTSPVDQRLIVKQPQIPAQALADGLMAYLREKKLV